VPHGAFLPVTTSDARPFFDHRFCNCTTAELFILHNCTTKAPFFLQEPLHPGDLLRWRTLATPGDPFLTANIDTAPAPFLRSQTVATARRFSPRHDFGRAALFRSPFFTTSAPFIVLPVATARRSFPVKTFDFRPLFACNCVAAPAAFLLSAIPQRPDPFFHFATSQARPLFRWR
jgi:hypothetical protein